MSRFYRNVLLATSAIVPLGWGFAFANPQGPQVVGGAATVQGLGTSTVTVTQQTNSAIINWRTFNISASETTRFVQPNANSVVLDRVTGGLGPSQILGTLSANGRVFVVNPDGILIGPGARVDTAGLLATTNNIANSDFMAGRYVFGIPGRPDASVVNLATITAQSGGFAALVAPGVRNAGTITATLGRVALASGSSFTLDLYGDRLITLNVNDSIAATVKDVATGQPLGALVKNTGTLRANGGRVELTAVAARQVLDSVINTTGVIEANSVQQQGGTIILSAATGQSKPADAPTQMVGVSGTLSAAGKAPGTRGGTVQVTGESIRVAGARINASGRAGGGKVLIGGDVSGGHPNPTLASVPGATPETTPLPNATTVTVDGATNIDASATRQGDGGKVIVWADGSTAFNGLILARGGSVSGNGGFVETSGKGSLSIQTGQVDTGAVFGQWGNWLLDPTNVVVSSGGVATLPGVSSFAANSGTTQFISPTTIGSALSNVILQAAQDVIFDSPITMIQNHVGLTAQAGRNVILNAGSSITTRGGNIIFSANDPSAPQQLNGSIGVGASLITDAGGLTGGQVTLGVSGGTGGVFFTPTSGNITTAGGAITIGGRHVTLEGIDAFTNTSLTLDTTGGGLSPQGANITFTGSVGGLWFGRQSLSLSSGGSDIFFGGNVTIGEMTITSARNVTATGFIIANSFFTDIFETGNLSIPGGMSTSGFNGTSVPGDQNAGPINIVTTGNVNIGTDGNSFIVAKGGYVLATGAGGNGANVSIWAGGTVTLSGISTRGGTPQNGFAAAGNAGSISVTGSTISLLGYQAGAFGVPKGLYVIALNADGGNIFNAPNSLPQNIAGAGGNITLNGNVVLRGGAGAEVVIQNASVGAATSIIINGSIDATTPYAELLYLGSGHRQITTGNIGANVALGNVMIRNNVSGSFGSVTAGALSRYYTPTSFGDIYGPSTTTFSGPVNITGGATLYGTNLIFASSLNIGGSAYLGSTNMSVGSISISGPTTIVSDTYINLNKAGGSMKFGSIDGNNPFMQSLTLDARNYGMMSVGNIGRSVPLRNMKILGIPVPPLDLSQNSIFPSPILSMGIAGTTLPTTTGTVDMSITAFASQLANEFLAKLGADAQLGFLPDVLSQVLQDILTMCIPNSLSAAQKFQMERELNDIFVTNLKTTNFSRIVGHFGTGVVTGIAADVLGQGLQQIVTSMVTKATGNSYLADFTGALAYLAVIDVNAATGSAKYGYPGVAASVIVADGFAVFRAINDAHQENIKYQMDALINYRTIYSSAIQHNDQKVAAEAQKAINDLITNSPFTIWHELTNR